MAWLYSVWADMSSRSCPATGTLNTWCKPDTHQQTYCKQTNKQSLKCMINVWLTYPERSEEWHLLRLSVTFAVTFECSAAVDTVVVHLVYQQVFIDIVFDVLLLCCCYKPWLLLIVLNVVCSPYALTAFSSSCKLANFVPTSMARDGRRCNTCQEPCQYIAYVES